MRRAVAVMLVGGCALATARSLPMWHDDRALWTAAAGVADTPRVAVNLARVSILAGDIDGALLWDKDALTQAQDDPATLATVSALVRTHLRWILTLTPRADVCTVPSWALWCASL